MTAVSSGTCVFFLSAGSSAVGPADESAAEGT